MKSRQFVYYCAIYYHFTKLLNSLRSMVSPSNVFIRYYLRETFKKYTCISQLLDNQTTFRRTPMLVGCGSKLLSNFNRTVPRKYYTTSFHYFKAIMYSIVERGTPNSTDYRVYFRDQKGPISPLHDIPLFADEEKKIYNMVVEVPRWTNAKMEISLKEVLNPIKQDIKKDKLRYVANCFPHHGYIWNYGALPQTWENPEILDPATGCKGDNDPIDVVEIGQRIAKRGDVIQVKVLGALALIDEGETDWKLIAIDVTDPQAENMRDIQDVERLCPGLIKATLEWFRIYKIPDGKPENKFAFNGEAKNREFTTHVIEDTHKFWQAIHTKEADAGGICCSSTTLPDTPFKLDLAAAEKTIADSPAPGEPLSVDSIIHKNHFIRLK